MRLAPLPVMLAVAVSTPALARAESCPTIAGGGDELAAIDAAERARFLERTLAREARRGRIWTHAWGWGLLGVSGGQVGAAQLFDDPDDRAVWYVSAGKAGLGVIWTFTFDRPRVSVPRTGATCADVAAAEAALLAAARDQRVGWLPRAESVALNAAAVLYLGLRHDRWGKALAGAAVAISVAELRLYTRPEGAISGLRAYRAGALSPLLSAPGERASWQIVPHVSPGAVGLGVAGAF